jgi:hypothetical protein
MSLTPAGSTTSSKSYDLPGGNFIADLDSGTGAILVPSGLTAKLCSDLSGTVSGTNCVVDCSYRQKSGGLSFGFDGGKTILVSYENLLAPIEESGTEFCFLQVGDSTITTSPATYILGAPFLRSSYAVFDWDNQNVRNLLSPGPPALALYTCPAPVRCSLFPFPGLCCKSSARGGVDL